MDLDVDEARARPATESGSSPTPRPNSIVVDAVLTFTRREHDPVTPVGRQPHDVEPAVGVGHEQDRPVRQPARERVEAGLAGDRPLAPVATSTSTICAVSRSSRRRWAVTAICAPSGDQARDVTSTPAGVRARASGARGSFAGRPRRGTGASMTHTCDQPRRRETNASRFPSGDQRGALVPALCPVTFASRDPSASTTQISSSRTNARRRPSGDHCGSLTGSSEAVSWVGYPPRSGIVNSCRVPAASAV